VWINAQVRGPAESLRQVQFATLDLMRSAQGHAGIRPFEAPAAAFGTFWKRRAVRAPRQRGLGASPRIKITVGRATRSA
jgi:hypothetical protein